MSESQLPVVGDGADTEPEAPQGVGKESFQNSELHDLWERRVKKSDNDLIIAVAASSRSAISGTGKTTLAIRLAQQFDATDGGFDGAEKASLDSEVVAEELIPDLEPKSSIIFDEAQGTLASDGVDSRRGMANAVVRMARAAAQYRKRQHTLIIVAQSTDWIDSRMMDLIDRLVLIQQRGYAKVYDHYRNDLPTASAAKEYTPVKERLHWEALPEDDADYQALDKLKEQANNGESEDEDSVDKDRQLAKAVKAYNEDPDIESWQDVADAEWAEFSREWYRNHSSRLLEVE